MSNYNEIIERLENLAKHAVHYVCEPPFVMSLDDGIALHDAIALLKEQEARVMTLEEIDHLGHAYVWAEIHSPSVQKMALIYCTVQKNKNISKFYNLDEESGVKWCRTDEDYNRDEFFGIHSGWRCWTSRPTDEQMQETPWEGEKD